MRADSSTAAKREGGLEPGPGVRQVAKAGWERAEVEEHVFGDGDDGPWGVWLALKLAPKFTGRSSKVEVPKGENVDRVSQRLDPTH